MRGPIYAWGDGEDVHIWVAGYPDDAYEESVWAADYPGVARQGIRLPAAAFDAIVMRRWSQMSEAEQVAAVAYRYGQP